MSNQWSGKLEGEKVKKRYVLLGVAALLTTTTVVGATRNGFDTETAKGATAEISVKNISVGMTGATKDGDAISVVAMPGGAYPCELNVYNGTVDGYDLYAKVEIYKYWETDNLDAGKADVYVELPDGSQISYLEIMESEQAESYRNDKGFVVVNDWLIQYADEEQIILYYTKPLQTMGDSEASSKDFMSGISFSPDMDNSYVDETLQLEYIITAVQRDNGEKAMAAEWGMFPLIAEDGSLVAVYEEEIKADGDAE